MYSLEDVGFNRGILSGALARLKQVRDEMHCTALSQRSMTSDVSTFPRISYTLPTLQIKLEREEKAKMNADLPKIPHGSLGSFKRGMQTVPLKVKTCMHVLCVSFAVR